MGPALRLPVGTRGEAVFVHRGQFVPRSSHTVSIWALAAVGALSGGAQSFGAVTFSWADIGLAGNAADTTGFGAVAYEC